MSTLQSVIDQMLAEVPALRAKHDDMPVYVSVYKKAEKYAVNFFFEPFADNRMAAIGVVVDEGENHSERVKRAAQAIDEFIRNELARAA